MVKVVAASVALLFVFAVWVVYPWWTYRLGTAKNMTVEVIAEPFLEGDFLVYRWHGDVVRACTIDVRREIIGSDEVVTPLIPKRIGAPPNDGLGAVSYDVFVPISANVAAGPAVYQATEIPQCNWMQRLFPVSVPYPPVHFVVTR